MLSHLSGMDVQDFQHVVGMNLVKLWDASDQLGLRVQLVLGGLLFTQLAERHSFVSCGNATEVRLLICDIASCPCLAVPRPVPQDQPEMPVWAFYP